MLKKNSLFLVSGQLLNSQRQTQVLLSRWAKEWMGVEKKRYWKLVFYVVAAQSLCQTHCHLMDCITPGFLILHNLPEFAQTQVHWVSDTIQPPHPLLSPSPPAPNLFPESGAFPVSHVFASDDQNTGAAASASVVSVNIQSWSPLRLTGLISLLEIR